MKYLPFYVTSKDTSGLKALCLHSDQKFLIKGEEDLLLFFVGVCACVCVHTCVPAYVNELSHARAWVCVFPWGGGCCVFYKRNYKQV